MQADRELLELAAKAAGYDLTDQCGRLCWSEMRGNDAFRWYKTWSPLEDDSDALRLAVDLCLDIRFVSEPDGAAVHCFGDYDDFPDCELPTAQLEGDPYGATRRAIVRAAAALAQETQTND